MRVLENVKLASYTTIKIGGIAKKLYIPEREEDLYTIRSIIEKGYLISGGSNLLINDKTIDAVANLRELDNHLLIDNGKIYAGASVRLQKLIRFANENNLGGIEYLFSVPGLVGGAIFMNAGSGKDSEQIGNYVKRVRVWHDGEIKWIEQSDCRFMHRGSLFKEHGGYVIIGAEFIFAPQDQKVSQKLIEERLNLCKETQDISMPNFGSLFKKSDPKIMGIFKKLSCKKSKKCHYSKKTGNWIVNGGMGTYEQVMQLIKRAEFLHNMFGKQCEREVIIWE